MARVEAVFELTDRVSRKLQSIMLKAKATEEALDKVGRKLDEMSAKMVAFGAIRATATLDADIRPLKAKLHEAELLLDKFRLEHATATIGARGRGAGGGGGGGGGRERSHERIFGPLIPQVKPGMTREQSLEHLVNQAMQSRMSAAMRVARRAGFTGDVIPGMRGGAQGRGRFLTPGPRFEPIGRGGVPPVLTLLGRRRMRGVMFAGGGPITPGEHESIASRLAAQAERGHALAAVIRSARAAGRVPIPTTGVPGLPVGGMPDAPFGGRFLEGGGIRGRARTGAGRRSLEDWFTGAANAARETEKIARASRRATAEVSSMSRRAGNLKRAWQELEHESTRFTKLLSRLRGPTQRVAQSGFFQHTILRGGRGGWLRGSSLGILLGLTGLAGGAVGLAGGLGAGAAGLGVGAGAAGLMGAIFAGIAIPLIKSTRKAYKQIQALEKQVGEARTPQQLARATDKLARAQAKLSPIQQRLIADATQLKMVWDKVSGSVRGNVGAIMDLALRAGTHVLRTAQPAIRQFGAVGQNLAARANAFIQSPRETELMYRALKPLPHLADLVGTAFGRLAKIVQGLFMAATPLATWVWTEIAKHFKTVSDIATSDKGIARWTREFDQFRPIIREVGKLLGALWDGILGLMPDVLPFATQIVRAMRTDLLPTLIEVIRQFTKLVGPPVLQLVISLLNGVKAIASPLAHIMHALAVAINAVFWAFKKLYDLIGRTPGIGGFLQEVIKWSVSLGITLLLLGGVIGKFGPRVISLVRGFGRLGRGVREMPKLFRGLGDFLTGKGRKGLTDYANAVKKTEKTVKGADLANPYERMAKAADEAAEKGRAISSAERAAAGATKAHADEALRLERILTRQAKPPIPKLPVRTPGGTGARGGGGIAEILGRGSKPRAGGPKVGGVAVQDLFGGTKGAGRTGETALSTLFKSTGGFNPARGIAEPAATATASKIGRGLFKTFLRGMPILDVASFLYFTDQAGGPTRPGVAARMLSNINRRLLRAADQGRITWDQEELGRLLAQLAFISSAPGGVPPDMTEVANIQAAIKRYADKGTRAPNLKRLGRGGFTAGPSIAGEAGFEEAVISMDPRHRARSRQLVSQAAARVGSGSRGGPMVQIGDVHIYNQQDENAFFERLERSLLKMRANLPQDDPLRTMG